jgi:pimeloyl-ACP methyl ester carboxylesterase
VHFIFWRNVQHQNKHPQKAQAELQASLPEPDQKALANEKVNEGLIQARADSLSPGIKGHVWEMRLFARPWRFQHQDIQVPIQLWYGEKDTVIAPEVGKRAHQKLPTSKLTLLPNEGHYSLLINQAAAILPGIVGNHSR